MRLSCSPFESAIRIRCGRLPLKLVVEPVELTFYYEHEWTVSADLYYHFSDTEHIEHRFYDARLVRRHVFYAGGERYVERTEEGSVIARGHYETGAWLVDFVEQGGVIRAENWDLDGVFAEIYEYKIYNNGSWDILIFTEGHLWGRAPNVLGNGYQEWRYSGGDAFMVPHLIPNVEGFDYPYDRHLPASIFGDRVAARVGRSGRLVKADRKMFGATVSARREGQGRVRVTFSGASWLDGPRDILEEHIVDL